MKNCCQQENKSHRNENLLSIQFKVYFCVQQHTQLIIMHEIGYKSDERKDNAKGSEGGLRVQSMTYTEMLRISQVF